MTIKIAMILVDCWLRKFSGYAPALVAYCYTLDTYKRLLTPWEKFSLDFLAASEQIVSVDVVHPLTS